MNDFTKEELELLELSITHSINFHRSCNLSFSYKTRGTYEKSSQTD